MGGSDIQEVEGGENTNFYSSKINSSQRSGRFVGGNGTGIVTVRVVDNVCGVSKAQQRQTSDYNAHKSCKQSKTTKRKRIESFEKTHKIQTKETHF
jgi:hypothetical protein